MNIESALYSLDNMLGGLSVLVGIVTLLWSLLQCYFGYIIFRVILAIQGFFTGAVIGALLGGVVGGLMDGGGAAAVCGIIGAILIGALGAWLAYVLYKLGVFMYYFVIGGVIGLLLGALMGLEGGGLIAIAVILGVIFGIVACIIDRYIIIISTAVCFGISAGSALVIITGVPFLAVFSLVFIVTGIIVQLKLTKKKDAQRALAAANAAAISQQQAMMAQQYAQNGQYIQNGQYAQPAPAPMKACPSCGGMNEMDTSFCTHCGYNYNQPVQQSVSYDTPAYSAPTHEPAPAPVYEQPAYSIPAPAPAPVYEEPAPAAAPTMSAPFTAETPVAYIPTPEPVTASAFRFCENCGTKITDGDMRFCDNCGAKLN